MEVLAGAGSHDWTLRISREHGLRLHFDASVPAQRKQSHFTSVHLSTGLELLSHHPRLPYQEAQHRLGASMLVGNIQKAKTEKCWDLAAEMFLYWLEDYSLIAPHSFNRSCIATPISPSRSVCTNTLGTLEDCSCKPGMRKKPDSSTVFARVLLNPSCTHTRCLFIPSR